MFLCLLLKNRVFIFNQRIFEFKYCMIEFILRVFDAKHQIFVTKCRVFEGGVLLIAGLCIVRYCAVSEYYSFMAR